MANDDREREIEQKFWQALEADRTVMLGLPNHEGGHAQPMTALVEDEEQGGRRPIWFFTAKDTGLVQALGSGGRGMLHFAAKDHELFASVEGGLFPDDDRAAIDRLWNPIIAAWYQGGKDDPKLQLLRFEPEHAQVWLNDNGLLAGLRLLLGRDPKAAYADKVADVNMVNDGRTG